MYKEINAKFMEVTPQDAERYLKLNNFPHQRPYRADIGKRYADGMHSKTHRRVDIAIAVVKENGQSFLMNGQHNCHAVILNGRPYPGQVTTYQCDSMHDAWMLFATFDVQRTRSESMFMASRRELFGEDNPMKSVPLRVLQCCGSALHALGDGVMPQWTSISAPSKTTKANCVANNQEEVLFVANYSEPRDLMMVVPVVAAIIATWRKDHDAAKQFWDSVATGAKLDEDDPRLKLRNALLMPDTLSTMCGRDRNKRMYALCVYWWNSWREGRRRRIVKLKSIGDLPEVK